MATMPARSHRGQPDAAVGWFGTEAGASVLDSEAPAIAAALSERHPFPWLWLEPGASGAPAPGRGLRLHAAPDGAGWRGAIQCALPLPFASESLATVVLQHVGTPRADSAGLLDETARVLLPGGKLWLFALNPLAPYRWRWRGAGVNAAEPLTWRRRLRAAGLVPDPVSQGVGPSWRMQPAPEVQHGAGLRAAYLLRAEKRHLPLTPTRAGERIPLGEGLSAA